MSKTGLPTIENLQVSSDDRGLFVSFILDTQLKDGVVIKRVYYVFNPVKNIVRGFHFHKYEWKFFTILQGSAKFIAIDPKKPREKLEFVTSERSQKLITIPPGYANGWVSLEDNTLLLAASSSSLDQSIKDDRRFNTYKWGDIWSVKAR